MINKRLLIKNLLSHTDENSFYDKKQKLSLESKEGKAKFLKHICALSNSNPQNNAYIIIGVEDTANKITGVDFFDDSKIQNLVNAYLQNPPKIEYENVPFPRLPRHKVVGLVTIYPNNNITLLLKNAWKYKKNTVFYRRGSNSVPISKNFELKNTNKPIVEAIEKIAKNNIELTLDATFEFFKNHQLYNPKYQVFGEQFVLCWAGEKKKISGKTFYSRVDIELVNEQVKLFFSALDDVQIKVNQSSFIITEFIYLGLNNQKKYYPLEKTIINFKNNGKYSIVKELLFEPLQFNSKVIQEIAKENQYLIDKIASKQALSSLEEQLITNLPTNYLICYLSGILDASLQLKKAKNYLKNLTDKSTYVKYKEALRIIRKVKYA
jgi:hypothetical protein